MDGCDLREVEGFRVRAEIALGNWLKQTEFVSSLFGTGILYSPGHDDHKCQVYSFFLLPFTRNYLFPCCILFPFLCFL